MLDHLRMPGYPEMMAIGNYGGQWKDNEAVRNGAAFWHTDQSYEEVPSSATMLFSIKSPETGGETQLADLKSAYDALSEDMKRRLEGRHAWHLYGASSGEGDEAVANPLITNEQVKRVPAVRHLVVRPHDVTGRKTLYGMAGTPYAIEGMDEGEGTEILKELKRHALQERFIYRHKYRVGDIAIYDTTQTLAHDRYAKEYDRLIGVMDRRLADREFLAGDYSIADMATWPWLLPYKMFGQSLDAYPNVVRWHEAMKGRPAARRGVDVGKEWRRTEPPSEEERRILFSQTGTNPAAA